MIDELMIHGRAAGRSARSRYENVRRSRSGKGNRALTPKRFSSAVVEDAEAATAERPIFQAPPGWPGPIRTCQRRRIELDTPIVPEAVADGVCEEVAAWFAASSPLPRRWVRELAGYANTVYAHNEQFRSRVRGRGNRGRDYLWVFMRHWLAAMLQQRRPEWFSRLPSDYCVGRDLPEYLPRRRCPDGTTAKVTLPRNEIPSATA